jgi:hypothetical protein
MEHYAPALPNKCGRAWNESSLELTVITTAFRRQLRHTG